MSCSHPRTLCTTRPSQPAARGRPAWCGWVADCAAWIFAASVVMRVAVAGRRLIPTKDPTRESPEKNHHHAVGRSDLLVVLHVARRKPPAAAARQRVAAVACTDGLPRQQLPKRSGQQRCLELSGQESWRARRFGIAFHLEGPRHVADVLHGGDAGTLGKGRHRRGWLPLHR